LGKREAPEEPLILEKNLLLDEPVSDQKVLSDISIDLGLEADNFGAFSSSNDSKSKTKNIAKI